MSPQETKKVWFRLEVTSEGKRKWIGTSVKLYADQWNEKKKVVNYLILFLLMKDYSTALQTSAKQKSGSSLVPATRTSPNTSFLNILIELSI